MNDYLAHYGRKGMKWGKNIFGKLGQKANEAKNLYETERLERNKLIWQEIAAANSNPSNTVVSNYMKNPTGGAPLAKPAFKKDANDMGKGYAYGYFRGVSTRGINYKAKMKAARRYAKAFSGVTLMDLYITVKGDGKMKASKEQIDAAKELAKITASTINLNKLK